MVKKKKVKLIQSRSQSLDFSIVLINQKIRQLSCMAFCRMVELTLMNSFRQEIRIWSQFLTKYAGSQAGNSSI